VCLFRKHVNGVGKKKITESDRRVPCEQRRRDKHGQNEDNV
jgi:hypothetical protein